MGDMAVHTLFIIGVYIALKMIIRQKFTSPKYVFFYTICLALMLYTSWLGVFFAFGIMVYSLLHVRDIKGFNVLIVSTALTTLAMLRVITYQYSQINGPHAYLSEMLNRYMQRGSFEETDRGLMHFMFSYLWLLKTLIYNYLIHYIIIYILVGLFLWLVASHKKLRIVFSQNGYRFIWLSVLPVVLLHFFFLNYSVHDFTVLYASLFFSVLIGILFDKVKKTGVVPMPTLQRGLALTLLLMVIQFYLMNKPQLPFIKTNYGEYESIAKAISDQSSKDEVIFLENLKPEPQIIYYAGRNIKTVESRDEAISFLRSRNLSKGVIFDWNNGISLKERIAL
jgi:hypothetical protein